MRKKNGFFSMSLIYSFFLVFALISAILLANYAHNRLLAKDYNDEIKINLNDRGDRKLINLRNKIQNSSFEADSVEGADYQWILSNATYASNQMYHSIRSISFNKLGDNKITQELGRNVVRKSHEYYFQYAYFTAGQPVEYTTFQIALRNSNNSKVYYFQNLANSVISEPNWKVTGLVVSTDESVDESDKWYFEVTKTGQSSNPLYLDAFLLTDLTQAYGYTEEASLEWLNKNIEYFESNYIHQRKDYEK
ncbi:MAG: hypothetical protein ACI31M_03825 [Bacilli bacterium]